jgi:hypothetical protein
MCSNTDLAIKIKGLETQLDGLMELNTQSASFQKEKLDAILAQTIKTNSRVTACEGKLHGLRFWAWLIEKPYRLVLSLFGLIFIVNFVDIEKIVELLLKIFK